MPKLPVLVIAHRRPHYLKLVLESLVIPKPSKLYISIDGPRNHVQGEEDLVKSCQDLVIEFQNQNLFDIETRFNTINLGSAANVIKSIDWFFENEYSGLILEEDCLPNPSIINYMHHNLNRFEHQERVWIVSGYRPQIAGLTNDPCLVHLPMNWGWGTWAPKWREMRKALLESTLKEPLYLLPFTSTRNVFWGIGARRAVNGWVDAWDTPLAHAMFKFDKLAYLPPMNLVSNIGTDSLALNTSFTSIFLESKTFNWLIAENLMDIPSIQNSAIDADDELIEKQMIGIKWPHRYLPIFKYLFQKSIQKRRGRGRLATRV